VDAPLNIWKTALRECGSKRPCKSEVWDKRFG
jgi:hypothetical protein